MEIAQCKLLKETILKLKKTLITILFACVGSINYASADMFIFPAQGQTVEEQELDEFRCQRWATDRTGFNPLATPTATTQPPSQQRQTGGLARGALGGAALGAIIGDSSRSAGRGAAAGDLIGGVRQNRSNTRVEQETEQWAQREAANMANNRNDFERAMTACLEGKGYTVR